MTLGLKLTYVRIEKQWGRPLVCYDGVTIAREFEIADREENMGARMLRETAEKAEKTGNAMGDGTSVATTADLPEKDTPSRFSTRCEVQ